MSLNDHHIIYDDPEWSVEIGAQMHRTITSIQRAKATPDYYARLTNFMHSIAHEWNRMRRELDTGQDLRTVNPKKITTAKSSKERGEL